MVRPADAPDVMRDGGDTPRSFPTTRTETQVMFELQRCLVAVLDRPTHEEEAAPGLCRELLATLAQVFGVLDRLKERGSRRAIVAQRFCSPSTRVLLEPLVVCASRQREGAGL